MRVDLVQLPALLEERHLRDRVVVVFDVLRATTTMAAALAAGVAQIRVFGSIDAARQAAAAFDGPKLLCGECECLRPEGFDLGNSPADFTTKSAGKTAFMSTTNGTRAILAAVAAPKLFIGAIVNASATAQRLASLGMNVTLLCAGTNGQPAIEDMLGAAAVMDALTRHTAIEPESDSVAIARHLYNSCRENLQAAMTQSAGGRNLLRAGLPEDIEWASRLDALNTVGVIQHDPLAVIAASAL
jgi:2-phosphosulfolactate phosphatase